MNKRYLPHRVVVAFFAFILFSGFASQVQALTYDEIVAYQTGPGRVLGTTTGPNVYDCQSGQAVSTYNYSTPDFQTYSANQTVAVNAFPSSGWLNGNDKILSNTYHTAALTNYLAPIDEAKFVLQSKTCSRDMELDTFSSYSLVILRRDPLTGDGIYFETNKNVPGGSFSVGIIKGSGESNYYHGTRYPLANFSLASSIPGWSNTAPSDNTLLTFGVSGFDIYAKFNGQEFFRTKEYRQMAPGTATLKSVPDAGFKKTTIRHMDPKNLFSDYQNKVLDLRDFGLKSVSTTGSINAGSNQLTVASSANLKIGDRIIVELGGEAGQGLRGTQGVGGTWPALGYNTISDMNADSSRMNDTYAYIKTDGSVYQFLNGSWQKLNPVAYYTNTVYPLALTASVTSISGNTLTLNTTAKTSSNNANVYFDNQPIIQTLVQSPFYDNEHNYTALTPSGATLSFPAGNYAVGSKIDMEVLNGWKLNGQGIDITRLFSPKGVTTLNFYIYAAPNTEISNMTLEGNFRKDGYGLATTENSLNGQTVYPTTILMGSDNGQVNNVKVIDGITALVSRYAKNVWGNNVQSVRTYADRQYLGWQLQWANSIGGGCRNCSVNSKYLIGGLEAFQSSGTQFINPVLVNAVAAINAAGNFLFDNLDVTVNPNSQFDENSYSPRNPMLNINTNINNSQGNTDTTLNELDKGGIIRNAKLTQIGYINSNNDILSGIIINEKNPNIQIIGGTYSASDYKEPSSSWGAIGINSTGPNILVDGFRIIGKTNQAVDWGNISIYGTGTGVVKNCVADKIYIAVGNPTQVQNCKTNAEYIASNPSLPTVSSFIASPASITSGSGSTLSWSVSGATSLSINNGIGDVSTLSQKTVSPSTTTTYTLTATNSAGTQTSSVTVNVAGTTTNPPNVLAPSISFFTVTPSSVSAGQSVTLAWETSNASALYISGIGEVTGNSINITPSASGLYTLTASNIQGQVSKDASVTVTSTPPPGNVFSTFVSNNLVNESGTVYVIEGQAKIGITNMTVFTGLGYLTKYIIPGKISDYEPSSYILSSKTMEHPWGSWLKDKTKLYYSTENGIMLVPSTAVFTNNRGLSKYIVPMNTADRKVLSTKRLPNMTYNDPRVTQE